MELADSESRLEWYNRCCELQNAFSQASKTIKQLEVENKDSKKKYDEAVAELCELQLEYNTLETENTKLKTISEELLAFWTEYTGFSVEDDPPYVVTELSQILKEKKNERER